MVHNREAALLSSLGSAQRRVNPQDTFSAMGRAYAWDYQDVDTEAARLSLDSLESAVVDYLTSARELLSYHANDDESE